MSTRVNDGRRKNWFWLDNVIIDKYAKDLKPMALAVYMYLCRRANDNGVCWPSQRTMAEDLGIDRGTARSAVKRLVELGLISLEIRRNEDGSHNSTLYTLLDVTEQRGGGSIAHRGPIAKGGLNSPKENPEKKNKVHTPKGVTPSGVSEEKRHNWFTEFCNRAEALGVLVTPEDRKRVPGPLKSLATKHNASDVEMQRVLSLMLNARLRHYPLSPKEALNDVRGIPTKRKPKPSGSIAVIGATEDDYAPESYIGGATEDDYRIEDYR